MTVLFIFLLLSFVLTYLVKYLADKKNLMDVPNERSSHNTPTPRGGGLAIAITWFSGICYLFFTHQIEQNLFYALLSGILISGISFLDDIYTLKSLPRIIVQSFSAFLALYFIGGFQELDLGFTIITNTYLLNTIGFVGILWFINLFNFIDGIDGYSSTGAVIISSVLYFFIQDILLLLLVVSVLGFIPWNWQKAKIFMGDIGSTLLGFTIAVLIINYNNQHQFSIIYGLIITSVFWFDATFTLIKRFRNKEKLSQAHRKHAYQRIVQFGFSHQKTVIISILINLLFFGLIVFAKKYDINALYFLVIAIIGLFVLYKLIDSKKPFNP